MPPDLNLRKPLVSIIIPTRDQRQLLETTLDGIWNRTDYERYEVIVVDNRSTEPEAVRYSGFASVQVPGVPVGPAVQLRGDQQLRGGPRQRRATALPQ